MRCPSCKPVFSPVHVVNTPVLCYKYILYFVFGILGKM